jgi:hypothetical protein
MLISLFRLVTVVVSAVVVASLAACTTDCTAVEPAYAGLATDEAWLELLDARVDATEGDGAPTFTAPEADVVVDAAKAPTFTWDSPLKLASTSPHALPSPVIGPWRRPAPSWLDRVSGLVLPKAHAHEPPITSDVYLLEVDVPGRTCPVAAVTTELSFAFDDEGWAAIVDGGGARTARLLAAFLTENNVTEGPFVAAPRAFTVEE